MTGVNKNKRVVIGLSGGVDSSVAAALLLEQGYQVEAVYLECYNELGCRTDQDKVDALKVAIKLGIKFQVLDFRKEYRDRVIEYFYTEYAAGRTPNPDVMCNREIKFGIFYDWALRHAQGKPRYDYIATGHYARIVMNHDSGFKNQEYFLQRAKDESKDQSYFLWQIPQDHLTQILFPLGEMLKSEVRVKAKELGLLTANKPDSMGICFIGEVSVDKLLKDRLGEKPGEVMIKPNKLTNQQTNGATIGTHRGLWFYTIGERGGFEIDKNKLKKLGMHPEKMGPLYVIGKNKEKNELVVGGREETMKRNFMIHDSRFMNQVSSKLWVRIRNLGQLVPVNKIEGEVVYLDQPIFGVAEGQSAVFYDTEGILVGGGIIV